MSMTLANLSAARKAVAVTLSDADQAVSFKGLWANNNIAALKLTFIDDSAGVTLNDVHAGTLLPFAVRRVWSTGTTAGASLIGLI